MRLVVTVSHKLFLLFSWSGHLLESPRQPSDIPRIRLMRYCKSDDGPATGQALLRDARAWVPAV